MLAAEVLEHRGAFDAHPGFGGSRGVIDPGVNDAAVVSCLVPGHLEFLLQDDDAPVRPLASQPMRGGEADDSPADDGDIEIRIHGRCRASSLIGVSSAMLLHEAGGCG